MAITNYYQILNTSSVKSATSHLDQAINYLEQANEVLISAKFYCGPEALNTNEGNNFIVRIDSYVATIKNKIEVIRQLKSNIETTAQNIYNREYNEYQEYQKELEASKTQVEAEA